MRGMDPRMVNKITPIAAQNAVTKRNEAMIVMTLVLFDAPALTAGTLPLVNQNNTFCSLYVLNCQAVFYERTPLGNYVDYLWITVTANKGSSCRTFTVSRGLACVRRTISVGPAARSR